MIGAVLGAFRAKRLVREAAAAEARGDLEAAEAALAAAIDPAGWSLTLDTRVLRWRLAALRLRLGRVDAARDALREAVTTLRDWPLEPPPDEILPIVVPHLGGVAEQVVRAFEHHEPAVLGHTWRCTRRAGGLTVTTSRSDAREPERLLRWWGTNAAARATGSGGFRVDVWLASGDDEERIGSFDVAWDAPGGIARATRAEQGRGQRG